MKAETTGIIILAAGGSKRLGRPKQLLPYEGITLLKLSIKVAQDSIVDEIVVVLGSNADKMENDVSGNNVQTVINPNWQEGIASSIRVGLLALMKTKPDISGAVIMLCDQPYVSVSLINEFITCAQNTGKQIVASTYGDVKGVPAWFHANLFPELMALRGDMGARNVIWQHTDKVATVNFPKGMVDIDTEQDYNLLIEDFSKNKNINKQ